MDRNIRNWIISKDIDEQSKPQSISRPLLLDSHDMEQTSFDLGGVDLPVRFFGGPRLVPPHVRFEPVSRKSHEDRQFSTFRSWGLD
jgi:hypothetical protein